MGTCLARSAQARRGTQQAISMAYNRVAKNIPLCLPIFISKTVRQLGRRWVRSGGTGKENSLTAPKGMITAYTIDEFGFATPLLVIVIAVYFWRRRKEVSAA